MSDHRIEDIEAQLRHDRAELAHSLAQLSDRYSIDGLVDRGRRAALTRAEPLLSGIDRMVRAQPLAAGVAGIALAALVFGRSRDTGGSDDTLPSAVAGTRFEALTRWEDDGGPVHAPPDPEEGWLDEAMGLRMRATALMARIDEAARLRLAPAAELARHRADVLASLSHDTREALGRGLGALGEAARDKAILPRERLYLTRIGLEAKGRAAVEEKPLATGMALAALGAAVAFLFRPTAAEDRLMGEASDRLVADAKAAAKAEVVRASDFASTLSAALSSDLERAKVFGAPPARPN